MPILKFGKPGIVRAVCISHVGKVRKNNEDNFCLNGSYSDKNHAQDAELSTWKKSFLSAGGSFFAVFDGMGGGDYGEVASFTAAEAASAFLSQGGMEEGDVPDAFGKLCGRMNEQVCRMGRNLGAWQMGSTLVSFYNREDRIWVCNLGDSRCYLLREGTLRQLSLDHSEREDGHGAAADRKPFITQYLGVDPGEMQIEPYLTSLTLQEKDRILLCSDGLTDMVPEKTICELLEEKRDPEAAVQALVHRALEAGGRDNITVMLCCTG